MMDKLYVATSIDRLAEMVCENSTKDHIENCVIEEMSELIKAVTKSRRGETNIDNLTEEIGHVILMCFSLMQTYNIHENDIIMEANDAVCRMLKAKKDNI